MLIELEVYRLVANAFGRQRALFLKATQSEEYFGLIIDDVIYAAIVSIGLDFKHDEPQTHELICTVVSTLGGKIEKVLIKDLRDDAYHASIIMDVSGRHVELDSRTSDAVALALLLKVPIFILEEVWARAPIIRPENQQPPGDEPISRERLAVFDEVFRGD